VADNEKVELYNALKEQGWTPDKHFRDYNVDELKVLAVQVAMANAGNLEDAPQPAAAAPPDVAAAAIPVRDRDPDEMAGARQNSNTELQPIRQDEHGRVWYQEEVQKPAFPKPRGRRVLKTLESEVVTQTVQAGDYVETFEVEGTGAKRPSEVKITLPSYQVGIYKDRRFPFKIHTYAGREGFDFFEVNNYYGGAELVPADIKRVYVSNVLCYDIRTVIRAIQTEYRQLQLQGKA